MEKDSQAASQLAASVEALLVAAFETGAEAELVSKLRVDKAMATEILVPGKPGLVGYAALSWMVEPAGWLCLAPVAVMPDKQGKGIGTKVVQLALKWAAERGHFVVVLGEPDFYGARGFSSARAAQLQSPYPVSHLLLAGPGDAAPVETLVYPAAFAEDE